jgi:FkbM family methyltransferase
MRRALWGAIRGKCTRSPVTLRLFGDRLLRLYPQTDYWRNIMYFGEHAEYSTSNLLTSFLREGDVFVDIGANIGYMSVIASSRIGKAGRILAFEPVPANFARLQENFALNGMENAEALGYALGRVDGFLSMQSQDTISHVAVSAEVSDAVRVPVKRLDDVLNMKATICKIDVEGYELDVLQGSVQEMAAGMLPLMVLELNGASRRYGRKDAELTTFLQQHGYRLGVFDPDRNAVDWDKPLWDDFVAANPEGQVMLHDRLAAESVEPAGGRRKDGGRRKAPISKVANDFQIPD